METASDGRGEEKRPSSCLVEEEYTIAIPLVRPKSPFLQFLHQAGASCEVFTKKEILQYLKKYIVSRKMFDEQDPRVVHCKGDPLGDVFGVDVFTIDDVLCKSWFSSLNTSRKTSVHVTLKRRMQPVTWLKSKRGRFAAVRCKVASNNMKLIHGIARVLSPRLSDLLARHCIQLPDTKLKRQRRLVSKPPSSIPSTGTTGGSFTISVCCAPSETSSPVISSTSGNRPTSQKSHLPPSSHRKSSSSSNCDTADSADSCSKKARHKGKKPCSYSKQIGSEVKEEATLQPSTDLNKESPEDKLSGQRSDLCEGSAIRNNHDKRKDESNHIQGSSRKRHKTEPGTPVPVTSHHSSTSQPSSSDLSRQRSTSLNIRYGSDDANGNYPWYFQLNVDDDESEGESEVLSVQGKETVIVQDSTDDLWFLEEESISVEVPSDTDFSVEYDIESDISPVTESDISSVRSGEGLLVVCQESDVEFFADCSETDSNSGDRELTEEDNWCCTECNYSNTPFQRYCSRCWKLRSDWLPVDSDEKADSAQHGKDKEKDLAAGLNRRARDAVVKDPTDSGIGSFSSQPSSQETVASEISHSVFKDCADKKLKSLSYELNMCESDLDETKMMETRYTYSNVQLKEKAASSQPVQIYSIASRQSESVKSESAINDAAGVRNSSVEDPCMICLTRTKNASLIHGSSGHQVCCFACAKRLKRRGKLCPVCRRPIQKVVKNYIL